MSKQQHQSEKGDTLSQQHEVLTNYRHINIKRHTEVKPIFIYRPTQQIPV